METLEIFFVLLVLTLFLGAVEFARRWYGVAVWKTAGVLGIWIGLQGWLARAGFFSQWEALPPRLVFLLLPSALFIAWAGFSLAWKKPLASHSTVPLVGFQSFRIGMEWILHALVGAAALPAIMTWTGRNFDIAVGASAPLIALLLWRFNPASMGARALLARRVGIVWNVLSFLILCNTVVHGMLSAPTPLRVFHVDPSTALIAIWPWIWLPGFVVPCALLGHVLSLRQLLQLKRRK